MNNIIWKCYELICNLCSYKCVLAKKYLNVVFIVQTIHDVENILIKKEFNKRIFSYNWFIENDCHDLQLKCPIKRDVIVMISPRLSWLVAWSLWSHTSMLHQSKLLYLFISINKNLINFIPSLIIFFKAIILYCMSL